MNHNVHCDLLAKISDYYVTKKDNHKVHKVDAKYTGRTLKGLVASVVKNI